jgi:thiamine biosynthesis protein ThiS
MHIVVNGEQQAVPEGLSVLELLDVLGIEPARVAIELNRAILRRPEWASARIEDNAHLEIVQFVGGG